MAKEDVKRYIKFEAPGMGMVENKPASVVCFNNECDTEIEVDPDTLVPWDDDAVDVVSEEMDMETGELTGRHQVEIFCSSGCRNGHYS